MILAETRKPDTKLGELCEAGKLPAVVYGHGEESIPLILDLKLFQQEIKKLGEGTLLDLKISEDESFKVLLQDTQKDPVKGDLLHIDLYRIKMDEKLSTEISLNFVGHSQAVKLGGVLIKSRDYLHVECLPKYLVSKIDIALSALKETHDSIKVKDIKMPEGVTVLDNPDLTVVNVAEAAVVEDVVVSKEEEEEAIDALGKAEGEEGEGEQKTESDQKKDAVNAEADKKDDKKSG